jgi:hypothetical protein
LQKITEPKSYRWSSKKEEDYWAIKKMILLPVSGRALSFLHSTYLNNLLALLLQHLTFDQLILFLT